MQSTKSKNEFNNDPNNYIFSIKDKNNKSKNINSSLNPSKSTDKQEYDREEHLKLKLKLLWVTKSQMVFKLL